MWLSETVLFGFIGIDLFTLRFKSTAWIHEISDI